MFETMLLETDVRSTNKHGIDYIGLYKVHCYSGSTSSSDKILVGALSSEEGYWAACCMALRVALRVESGSSRIYSRNDMSLC